MALPARAQKPDITACNSEKNPDLRIPYCTDYIERGASSQTELSWAYMRRGSAYAQKGDHDRAIRDYDSAIRQQPTNAPAFMNRGFSYAGKGDFEHALQD